MSLIAPFQQTKYITLSSGLFCITSYYAYYNSLYFYAIILLLTSVISANYWRNATYSWRRNIDLLFSKLSFTIFVYNGMYYVNIYNNKISYIGLPCLIYCYYLSNKLFIQKNLYWIYFHIIFHIIMTYEQYIILYHIKEYLKN
jgi:hypothetical protein